VVDPIQRGLRRKKSACKSTFAVVLLQDGNAAAAAAIASLVSATPMSGTVPNSSFVAGSAKETQHLIIGMRKETNL